MSYVSTSLNRYYAALESGYGAVQAVADARAFRALRLDMELVQEYLQRRDKSGSRSFSGIVAAGRRQARFELDAYLMSGGQPGLAPDLGPLYQAACGGAPLAFAGGTAAAGCTASHIVFASPHSLSLGQAIESNGELRFVTAIANPTAVDVTPPFSQAPAEGSAIRGSVSYPLAAGLPSVSIFDYWEPATAQQRILNGGAVESVTIEARGDFHTVKFAGNGQDLIDSITFEAGQGGLAGFPTEPAARSYAGGPIAGHFGQLWLGASPARFSTVVEAALKLENGLQLRSDEIGSAVPLGIAPGDRKVTLDFQMYETDDAATQALYASARNRTPIAAFLQLGGVAGHLVGAYLNSIAAQPPKHDSGERQLKWSFTGARAAGAGDDELWIAFG
jgi:hypothetical protein